jgi:hypothetical protein
MFELCVDSTENNTQNINALWEIQLQEMMQFALPNYEQAFLLKHVATGCYLLVTEKDDETLGLGLTYNGMEPACKFVLKSKKNTEDYISYSESVKI